MKGIIIVNQLEQGLRDLVELGGLVVEAGRKHGAQVGGKKGGSRAISLRVPEPLLIAFKSRCEAEGLSYQRQIKSLMLDWVLEQDQVVSRSNKKEA